MYTILILNLCMYSFFLFSELYVVIDFTFDFWDGTDNRCRSLLVSAYLNTP